MSSNDTARSRDTPIIYDISNVNTHRHVHPGFTSITPLTQTSTMPHMLIPGMATAASAPASITNCGIPPANAAPRCSDPTRVASPDVAANVLPHSGSSTTLGNGDGKLPQRCYAGMLPPHLITVNGETLPHQHKRTLRPGECLSLKVGDTYHTIKGPSTVAMVYDNNNQSSPNLSQISLRPTVGPGGNANLEKCTRVPSQFTVKPQQSPSHGSSRNGGAGGRGNAPTAPTLNQHSSTHPQRHSPLSNYPYQTNHGVHPSASSHQHYTYATGPGAQQQGGYPPLAPYHPQYHHHPMSQQPVIHNGTMSHPEDRRNNKVTSPRLKSEQLHALAMHQAPHIYHQVQLHNHPRMNGSSSGLLRNHMDRVPDPNSCSNSTDSREEDDKAKLQEILSSIPPPTVEAEAKSAVTHIVAPDVPEYLLSQSGMSAEVQYKLLLQERNNAPFVLYQGDATTITMRDLKPATGYNVTVCAMLEDVVGNETSPTSFTTLATVPDAPPIPKLCNKSKSYIFVKWRSPADNGHKIESYILQFCKESLLHPTQQLGSVYEECYNGPKTEFKLSKPEPSHCYLFRVAATNALGQSEYSGSLKVETPGVVPQQPDPPQLAEVTVNSIHLKWTKRSGMDKEFSVQQEEDNSDYGFMAVYSGSDTQCRVEKLRKSTAYRFRLLASNDDGKSSWSQIVTYRTRAAVPSAPTRLTLKGKAHSDSFRLSWDAPADDGGSEVQVYLAQLDSGSGYRHVYEGSQLECSCTDLHPGHTYRARVAARSEAGQGGWSEVTSVTTKPVVPSVCDKPSLIGKAKAHSLQIKWAPPSKSGGAPVTEYSVQLIDLSNTIREVYRGHDLHCTVAGLFPGRVYLLQVRAVNIAGEGDWSLPLEVLSGAGVPEAPAAPECCAKSAHSVYVSWQEPCNNGARISEYRLEMCNKPAHLPDPEGEGNSVESPADERFSQVYSGQHLSHEVKQLHPHTEYVFRVSAVNSSGPSHPSQTSCVTTLPSSPCPVGSVQLSATATSVHVTWQQPDDNGSQVTHYIVEYGKNQSMTVPGDQQECVIDDLLPDTCYKIRVQAVNAVGSSPFSSQYKTVTELLPPVAPCLECVRSNFNSVHLRWNEVELSQKYIVWKSLANANSEPVMVHQGSMTSCKIGKLQENTTYNFYVSASNKVGDGELSAPLTIRTCRACPHALKAPTVEKIGLNECAVRWGTVKSMGTDTTMEYRLQLSESSGEYKQVFQGEQTTHSLVDLQPGTKYTVRVCPVRMFNSDNADDADNCVLGAYSPGTSFETLPVPTVKETEAQVDTTPTKVFGQVWRDRYHQFMRSIKPRKENRLAAMMLLSMFVASLLIAFILSYVFNAADNTSNTYHSAP